MLDPAHRTVESIGLELAALRVEHALQVNLIARLADALYMTPTERRTLELLEAQIAEVAAWHATHHGLPPPGITARG